MSERPELFQSENNDNSTVSSVHVGNENRQMGDGKQISAGALSWEELEEIAEKVYRMMQRDLMLERERATKIGG